METRVVKNVHKFPEQNIALAEELFYYDARFGAQSLLWVVHSHPPRCPIVLDAFQSARRDVVERLHQELRAAGVLADEARFEVARKMTEVCGGKGWVWFRTDRDAGW